MNKTQQNNPVTFDLPDCTKLNQQLPKTRDYMMSGSEIYSAHDSWVLAYPMDAVEIPNFELREDWLNNYNVYIRRKPIDAFLGNSASTSHKLDLASEEESLWVSFDTEYMGGEGVDKRWSGKRQVVSWQFTFAKRSELIELLITSKTQTPLCLSHALNLICELAGLDYCRYRDGYNLDVNKKRRKKGKRQCPLTEITLISHSGLVDITTFIGSKHLLQRMATKGSAVFNAQDYRMIVRRDASKNSFRMVNLKVRDTMSFTAQGTSLRALGDAIGLPKLDTISEEDYMDMGGVLESDPVRFAEYAVRDTEICWAYMAQMLGTYNKQYTATIPAMAANYLKDYVTIYWCGADPDEYELKFRGLKKVAKGLKKSQRTDTFYVNEWLEPISPIASEFMTLNRNAYRGGMNACTYAGYFTETDADGYHSYDYDLTSAYPLCLGSLPNIDWESGYEYVFEDEDLTEENFPMDAFLPGAGTITFEFPEDCYLPSIGLSIGSNMVFSQTSGEAKGIYVTQPEVYTALKLGAKIHAVRYVIAKKTDEKDGILRCAYKKLIDARMDARKKFGKKSVQEMVFKLMANSLYGKMAQSLSKKSYRDLFNLELCELQPSRVTSAYHASAGTSLTRCILAAAINELHEKGFDIYSVTTDGFISNAPQEVVDDLGLYGLKEGLVDTRQYYTDGEQSNIIEVKHKNADLLNITTRGNVSSNTEGVFARAGLKGYPEVQEVTRILGSDAAEGYEEALASNAPASAAVSSAEEAEVAASDEEFEVETSKEAAAPKTVTTFEKTSAYRARFMAKVLLRKSEGGKAKYHHNQWVSASDMLVHNEDFHTYAANRSVNFNFDMKRKPDYSTLHDVLVEVPVIDEKDGIEHIDAVKVPFATFDTVPFRDADEYLTWRSHAEVMTLIDSSDYLKLKERAESGIRVPRGHTNRDYVRLAVVAHRARFVNIPSLEELEGEERLEWINGFLLDGERRFTKDDWSNAAKQSAITTASCRLDEIMQTVVEMGGSPREDMSDAGGVKVEPKRYAPKAKKLGANKKSVPQIFTTENTEGLSDAVLSFLNAAEADLREQLAKTGNTDKLKAREEVLAAETLIKRS